MPKAIAAKNKKIENAWVIAEKSWRLIWDHKKHFAIILAFYALAYIIAVQSSSSIASVSSTLSHYRSIYHGSFGGLWSGVNTYVNLMSSLAGANSPAGGAYQTVLFISLSLVIIWSVKQFINKQKITVRDAFYKSSTPLIPFFLILLLIGVELIPVLIASALYNVVIVNGVAIMAIEKVLWIIFFILLTCVSIYFVTSSLFALYIATSEQLKPMQAIKTARKYVKGRRIIIFGRIIFMPIVTLLIIGVLMLPVILIVPVAAAWILSLLLLVGLTLTHCYLYNLSLEIRR